MRRSACRCRQPLDFPVLRLPASLIDGRWRAESRRRGVAVLPGFEQLESFTLLSGSILGTVWSDPSGSGVRAPGAAGVAGETVFLDLGKNHTDQSQTTVAATSTAITAATGLLGGVAGGAQVATLPVQGLPATLTGLTVTMDLTNNGTAPVIVGVISPVGATVPQFPTLFEIQPGEHFDGSFDQDATTQVTLAPRPLAPGTYIPQQSFGDPPSHIDGTDPNGDWGLVFVGDTSGLVLSSWSLTFTTPDPTTETDASGNYAFTGLAAGTYQVETLLSPGDTQTSPSGGAPVTVQLADDQTASGVNFGVQAASNLVTQSFALSSPATGWGQPVTINYTLTNQGNGDAPAFDVGVMLSADGTISASGPLLKTLSFSGLAAHATVSGTVTVTLPAAAPVGFGPVTQSYIGFLIDPTHALAHNDAADDANQGLGVDEAALAIAPNQAVAAGPGVQQMPDIAVDPADPDHLVVADMDSTLVTTGYEGIGVSVSYDGGSTWRHSVVPLPAGFNEGAAAPTVQFDGKGNVFVSFMAATFLGPNKPALTNPSSTQRLDGFESDNGIFVSRSSDGGLTWGTPVAVVSHTFTGTPGTLGTTGPSGTEVPFDYSPDFAIDTNKTLPGGVPNPNFGNLYVTWVRAYPAGQFPGQPGSTDGTDIMVAASTDGGQTWTTRTQTVAGVQESVIKDPKLGNNASGAAGLGYAADPQITIGPEGDLYVSAYAGGAFTVYHSTDAGVTFRAPDYTDEFGLPFGTTPILPAQPFVDDFPTLPVRDIVADPSHPGRVYVVDAAYVDNSVVGGIIDSGEIVFAYSNDYGLTWENQFQVGHETTNLSSLPPGENDQFLSVLNDDDDGRDTAFDTATQLNQEVIDEQALPSISVDAQGDLTVIWYDTRRDPTQTDLDVFGTVSTDGGQTFSPNFRITDTSFNPNLGAFTDADGETDDSLGGRISVAAVNGTAYAVWTDTRNGSQDIDLQQYSLTLPPAPPPDRLYPDNTPQTATALGEVTAPQIVPSLTVGPANDNWFSFQAGATGVLSVLATATSGDTSALQVTLTDANGNPLPAVATLALSTSGAAAGTQLVYPGVAGRTYLVHVSGGGSTVGYTLSLGALTADLGTSVQGETNGLIAAGGQVVDQLTAAVTGSLDLTLTPAGDTSGALALQVLSADGQTILASGPSAGSGAGSPQIVTLPVTQGEVVLLQVTGVGPNDAGDFTLAYTNPDQYETAGAPSIFLPTSSSPASIAVADLTGNSVPDIIVSSTDTADPVNVFLGNADGTFEAPHQYDVGPGLSGALTAGYRQVVVSDLNGDGIPDIVVPNFDAGDVSVLLGNGDGTFQPQRRFDAVTSPDSLVTGDFNGDGNADLAVLQNFPQLGGVSQLAILMGRGDGTFKPAQTYATAFSDGAGPMVVGDFTGNGIDDIIVFSKNEPLGQIFLGNGDGTFRDGGVFSTGENVYAAEAVDLNGNGTLSLITTGTNSGDVYVIPGLGDGRFGVPTASTAMAPAPGDDVGVYGLAVVGFQSTVSGSAPMTTVAGTPGVYVTAQSRSGSGPGEVIFLPAKFDAQGYFSGFAVAQPQATLLQAGKIAAFNENGMTDLAATDTGGVRVIEGVPASTSGAPTLTPNTTPATARDLGNATHLVTLSQAVISGHEDAYYTYTVPTEENPAAGPQVVDFSSAFQDVAGAGLGMEILGPGGQVLGSGDRVRVVAAQGEALTIHIFGFRASGEAQGTGVYTLDVDTLPQLVSVAPLSVTPGGAVTSLSLTIQGDRLDPTAAEDPSNYTVTFLGPDGGQIIPVASSAGGQPVVYDPSVNLKVTSGLTYPTAARQTVTLNFAQPLPAGSYRITLSPAIQADPFSPGEAAALAGNAGLAGHPLVSVVNGAVVNGATIVVNDLVSPTEAPAGVGSIADGSPFLTQLQADLTAILDQQIEAKGDDPSIGSGVNAEILSRFAPLFAAAGPNPPSNSATPPRFTILWFDPVSIDLQSAQGPSLSYNLSSNQVANGLASTFVSVGGNVELIVMEGAAGAFNLDVANVPASARGGEVEVSAAGASEQEFTAALRGGETSFNLETGETDAVALATTGPSLQSLATLASTFLVAGPFTTSVETSETSAEAPSGAEATAAVSAGGATVAVTQPLATARSVSGGPGQDVPGQPEGDGARGWVAVTRSLFRVVVKRLTGRFGAVLGALRGRPQAAVLRLWGAVFDNLIRVGAPGGANDAGARGHAHPDRNPAANEKAPVAPPRPAIRPVAGERRDTSFLDPRAAGTDDPAREPASGPQAILGAAIVSSGLYRGWPRDLRRAATTSSRRQRPEPSD